MNTKKTSQTAPARMGLTDEQKAQRAQEKAEKFRALAVKRVNKALNSIRLVGNLSNRAQYRYTEEEAAKVTDALKDAVDEVTRDFDVYDSAYEKNSFSI